MPKDKDLSDRPPKPYFLGWSNMLEAMKGILDLVGLSISTRRYVYHRGAFYADCAIVIDALLEVNWAPFIHSEYNWRWWSEELKKRAEDLGMDASYAMHLPAPWNENSDNAQEMYSRLDLLWRYMPSIYAQEAKDNQTSPMGQITAAECVKITQRFANWLERYGYNLEPNFPGSNVMKKVTWPWLEAVQDELREVYREMGEDDVAGGWGPGGGPMPPISWPGE